MQKYLEQRAPRACIPLAATSEVWGPWRPRGGKEVQKARTAGVQGPLQLLYTVRASDLLCDWQWRSAPCPQRPPCHQESCLSPPEDVRRSTGVGRRTDGAFKNRLTLVLTPQEKPRPGRRTVVLSVTRHARQGLALSSQCPLSATPTTARQGEQPQMGKAPSWASVWGFSKVSVPGIMHSDRQGVRARMWRSHLSKGHLLFFPFAPSSLGLF